VKVEDAKSLFCYKHVVESAFVFEATNEASRLFDDSSTQYLLFLEIFTKPTLLHFDQLNGRSDG
jgi:hypothetical protein